METLVPTRGRASELNQLPPPPFPAPALFQSFASGTSDAPSLPRTSKASIHRPPVSLTRSLSGSVWSTCAVVLGIVPQACEPLPLRFCKPG
jgi:hypothetical protein